MGGGGRVRRRGKKRRLLRDVVFIIYVGVYYDRCE